MKLTRNFDSSEFACECKQCNGNVTLDFVRKMQDLRDLCGFPLPINSGYRCSDHNKKIGGAPSSRHMYGDACDIGTGGLNGMQKLQLIENARKLGFTGFGISPVFLHLDTRPGPVTVWFYPIGKISGDS